MTTMYTSGVSILKTWPRGLVLSIALFGPAACAQSAPAQSDNISTAAPVASKVSPRLQTAAQQLLAGESPSAFQSGLVHADTQGRLQVYIYINDFTPGNLNTLATHGLVEAMPSPSLHLVQGWVKPQDIERLARLVFVTRITPAHYAQTR